MLTRLLLLLGDDGMADGEQAKELLQPRLLRRPAPPVLLVYFLLCVCVVFGGQWVRERRPYWFEFLCV